MKRLFGVMLSIFLCISLSSCMGNTAGDSASHDTSEIFRVYDYPILITTPSGWKEESDMGSFDLQCLSPKRDMYLSIYGYSVLDLAEDQTAQELFELQTARVFSARDNAIEIEPVSMTEDEEKILYRTLYSAEHDGAKNYYQLFFIHYKSTDDMAWIMFNGRPSIVEKRKESINDIISKVQNSEPEKEDKP